VGDVLREPLEARLYRGVVHRCWGRPRAFWMETVEQDESPSQLIWGRRELVVEERQTNCYYPVPVGVDRWVGACTQVRHFSMSLRRVLHSDDDS
jgi:hypothetical protein